MKALRKHVMSNRSNPPFPNIHSYGYKKHWTRIVEGEYDKPQLNITVAASKKPFMKPKFVVTINDTVGSNIITGSFESVIDNLCKIEYTEALIVVASVAATIMSKESFAKLIKA